MRDLNLQTEITLSAGDVLFLPRGYLGLSFAEYRDWLSFFHEAVAVDGPSLHLSVGADYWMVTVESFLIRALESLVRQIHSVLVIRQ